MIHWWLHDGLNLVGYVTFRSFAGGMTAFLLSLALGRGTIRLLRRLKAGQVVRTGAEMAIIGHGPKAGTPTMGGLLIVATTTVAAAAWCDLRSALAWLVWGTMAAMACVGIVDDLVKLKSGKSDGLKVWQKLLL